MTAERPQFTPEQVARAERRDGVGHPLIPVIDRNLTRFAQLRETLTRIPDLDDADRFIRANYGFFAGEVVAAGPFPMSPLDMVSLWSRVREVFTANGEKYALARVVSCAYAIDGIGNQAWTRFPREYLEHNRLPKAVETDHDGLVYVQGRLQHIGESLDALNVYVYGTEEAGVSLGAQMSARTYSSNVEADKALKELGERQKERMTPVIKDIQENFGNGWTTVRLCVEDALRRLTNPRRRGKRGGGI